MRARVVHVRRFFGSSLQIVSPRAAWQPESVTEGPPIVVAVNQVPAASPHQHAPQPQSVVCLDVVLIARPPSMSLSSRWPWPFVHRTASVRCAGEAVVTNYQAQLFCALIDVPMAGQWHGEQFATRLLDSFAQRLARCECVRNVHSAFGCTCGHVCRALHSDS